MTGWLAITARPGAPGAASFGPRRDQALRDPRMDVRCRPGGDPGRRRGRALGRRTPTAGPGCVGQRGRRRAGGVGPRHRSADPGRDDKEHPVAQGPAAQARRTPPPGGAGYRRDADTPQPAIAERPGRPYPCTDRRPRRLRRAVGPAPPAAADSARDRQRNLQHRDLCPGGGPGRAAAQAEDRRRPGPVRSRIASPAPGGIGRTPPVTAGPTR
jgi:hypothetical protein